MSTATAAAKLPEITIGQILVMGAEFQVVFENQHQPVKDRLRASKLVQLLDEIIAFREKEGARAASA